MSIATSENDVDFSKLKVAELKQELKKRGLSTDGKKNELIERLQTSIGDAALLDDSQDDLLDDAELSDEEVLDDSAIDTPPSEPIRPSPRKRPVEEEAKRHPKKIILNRKTVEAPDPEPVAEVAEPAKSEEPAEVQVKTAEVDRPKLHVLTDKERREKRMARFGALADTKPAAEAAVAGKLGTTPIGGANIDLLKKRAQRFGTIAPVLEKVKIEEKKVERLKRFGEKQLATATAAVTLAGTGDKKAQRAARFAS